MPAKIMSMDNHLGVYFSIEKRYIKQEHMFSILQKHLRTMFNIFVNNSSYYLQKRKGDVIIEKKNM